MPFLLQTPAPVVPHVRGSYVNVSVNHSNAHAVSGPWSALSSAQAGPPSSPNPQGGEGGVGSGGGSVGPGGSGGPGSGSGGGGDAGGGGSVGGLGPGGSGPGGGSAGGSGVGGTGSGGSIGPMPQDSVNPYVGVRPPPAPGQYGSRPSGVGCSGSMGDHASSPGSGLDAGLLGGGPFGNPGVG